MVRNPSYAVQRHLNPIRGGGHHGRLGVVWTEVSIGVDALRFGYRELPFHSQVAGFLDKTFLNPLLKLNWLCTLEVEVDVPGHTLDCLVASEREFGGPEVALQPLKEGPVVWGQFG